MFHGRWREKGDCCRTPVCIAASSSIARGTLHVRGRRMHTTRRGWCGNASEVSVAKMSPAASSQLLAWQSIRQLGLRTTDLRPLLASLKTRLHPAKFTHSAHVSASILFAPPLYALCTTGIMLRLCLASLVLRIGSEPDASSSYPAAWSCMTRLVLPLRSAGPVDFSLELSSSLPVNTMKHASSRRL